MQTSKFSVRSLALSGIIAAIYAGLTLVLPIPQYGGVQLRVAEAMTLLPFLLPEAALGLTVGCFLANLLGSPYVLDWVFGTLATFLAAVLTRRMPNKWLAAVPPVLCNAVIIGAEVAYFSVLDGAAFGPAFALNALTVGLGEAIACFALGVPLVGWMQRNAYMREFLAKKR
ncbi:MAG: QueT transporter family protein [Oscillibacter sp.]|nr:QueT transporter family protein [Oscillibacter sp.]